MNIVIATDSFKGSLSSVEAGNAISTGIKRVYKNADVEIRPLADGGEGTVEALVQGMNGELHTVEVSGPLCDKVKAAYGIIPSSKTAIIEMSAAAGITMVTKEQRNPLVTTTYGVGQLIVDAINKGCRHFIVGIGGSATNDGGVGMLQALGYNFLDINGKEVPFGGQGLELIHTIKKDNVIKELAQCQFRVACDVTNPLFGKLGSSHIFGPQKGATPEMVLKLDKDMEHYANVAKETFVEADPYYPGTGAAGGLGFAFKTFTNAELQSGIAIVLDETRLEEYIEKADIVITGEGMMDGQTAMGKAPIGVAKLAKKHNKPVIAFAGGVTADANENNNNGIDAFFPILRRIVTLEEAMQEDNAKNNMADTAEQVFRLWKTKEDIK
ncbi:glycerate kinase [Mycoplasma sp. P36-A1]|uniref:glycerate kinase family protein n=1 Tax=Mycoplasma sp. P36-A1 TaxID=3252900 RepID=UPI003C2FFED5